MKIPKSVSFAMQEIANESECEANSNDKSSKPVGIIRDRLMKKLLVEVALTSILVKVVEFVIYFTLFLMALQFVFPSREEFAVRRQLEAALGTAEFDVVKSSDSLLSAASTLARILQTRRPTFDAYWCQYPYLRTVWDHDTEGPERTCHIPDLLGVEPVHDLSSYHLNTYLTTTIVTTTSVADLWNLTDADENTTTTTTKLASTTTTTHCKDEDTQLALSLNDENATCQLNKQFICHLNLGVLHCPATCGLCAPVRFSRLQEFVGPSLVLTPLMIFQTRFAAHDCDEWLRERQANLANVVPLFTDSFDTSENVASIGACVDREKQQKSDLVFKSACPDTASNFCIDGTFALEAPKRIFRGDAVFARMIIQPDIDVMKIRSVEWLDRFTDKVTLSALMYTEGLQVYTFFAVEFTFDVAGNVAWNINTKVVRERSDAQRGVFNTCAALCIIVTMLSLAETVYTASSGDSVFPNKFHIFELSTRLLLFMAVVMLAVLDVSQQGNTMSKQFGGALDPFLDIDSSARLVKSDGIADAFFETADILSDRADMQDFIAIFLYMVIALQLVQFVVYFNFCHPSTAIITRVIRQSLAGLLHLAILVSLVLSGFAFVQNWIFGSFLPTSETYRQTMISLLQAIYGERIMLPGVSELDTQIGTAYWIFALIFSALAFFLLKFVVVAVIVNSFIELRKANGLEDSRTFFVDVINVMTTPFGRTWPSRRALMQWLLILPEVVRSDELAEIFSVDHARPHRLTSFIAHLRAQCPQCLCVVDGSLFKSLMASEGDVLDVAVEDFLKQERKSATPVPMNVKRVAQNVVHDVFVEMAKGERVNWLSMTGKASCTLYREFSSHGLILNRN